MLRELLILVSVLTLSWADRCSISARKLQSQIRKYKKCLANGLEPDPDMGCVRVLDYRGKLTSKAVNQCIVIEYKLRQCEYSCEQQVPEWNEYGEWSECSAACGGGTKARTRTCSLPPLGVGSASQCPGGRSQTVSCNTQPCPVDGGWTRFGGWADCSEPCSGGRQSRQRSCSKPTPAHGGSNCTGSSSKARKCNTHPCLIDGGWTEFSSWSTCSEPCDGGLRTRERTCTNPLATNGGTYCTGNSFEIDVCNGHSCQVDGDWSDFGEWSACSESCGGGTQSRQRSCTNPSPAHGGMSCSGSSSDSQGCNTHTCPIHGGWSGWGSWSACSESCGGGTQSRQRSCTSPSPAHSGMSCSGSSSNGQGCNTHTCPIHGGWSGWGGWSACSESCGGGTRSRQRSCTNPSPAHGGMSCFGSISDGKKCNTHICPIHGAWSGWGSWSGCFISCDGGRQTRYRSCTNPAPAHGGMSCSGSSSDGQGCSNFTYRDDWLRQHCGWAG